MHYTDQEGGTPPKLLQSPCETPKLNFMALVSLIGYVLIPHLCLFFKAQQLQNKHFKAITALSIHEGKFLRKFSSDETLAFRGTTLEDIFKTP